MNFPTEFLRAQKCVITSKTFTEVTSYGFNTEVARRGNPHQWLVEFTTPPLNEEKARSLHAFLDSLDGRYNTFTLPCPLKFMSAATSFNAGNANAGKNSMTVSGLPNNTEGALKAGDYIKFSNHDKVYKITTTEDSNGSGQATLNFHPRLFANVSSTHTAGEAVFTLRMTKDESTSALNAKTAKYPVLIKTIEA